MPTLQTYTGVYLWNYVPSLPASIIFTTAFAILSALHTWKMVQYKLWFCIPFITGGIFEVIGYAARAAAYNATGSLPVYTIQAIFIVLPPVFFAATLYMVYSRIVRAVRGEDLSIIAPRWTTAIFVIGDLLCLNIQSSGSGLLVKDNTERLGSWIVVGGLILQVLLFVGFMICCLVFHSRFRSHVFQAGDSSGIPWRSCLHMLYATSIIILVRNVYRVVEFILGKEGYLMRTEWPTYAFDGVLMLVVMAGFYIWYPSNIMPRLDQSTELESTGSGEEQLVKNAERTNRRQNQSSGSRGVTRGDVGLLPGIGQR